MGQDVSYALAGLSALVSVFMLGGLAGFMVSVTHESRMDRWARGVVRAWEVLTEAEERGGDADGIARLRRSLGLDGPETAEEHSLRAQRLQADVQPQSGAAVVDTGQGSPAVRAS